MRLVPHGLFPAASARDCLSPLGRYDSLTHSGHLLPFSAAGVASGTQEGLTCPGRLRVEEAPELLLPCSIQGLWWVAAQSTRLSCGQPWQKMGPLFQHLLSAQSIWISFHQLGAGAGRRNCPLMLWSPPQPSPLPTAGVPGVAEETGERTGNRDLPTATVAKPSNQYSCSWQPGA